MTSVRSLAGAGSLRAYGTRLGEQPTAPLSLRRLTSADLLQRGYERYGGVRTLGAPVGDVILANGGFSRQYGAGSLRLAAGAAQLEGQIAYRARVFVAGVKCIARAETDQFGGPSSEPYLIASVLDQGMVKGEAKAILVGGKAAEDIDGGDWIGYGEQIWEGASPGELQIQLAMWEEDGGQSGDARKKVETTINDAITVAGLVFPVVGIVRGALGKVGDRIVSSLARFIKEPFKDDFIAQAAVTLGYQEFMVNRPPVQTFEGAKFRTIVPIEGGKAGIYRVYLHWTVEQIPVPEP